MYIFRLFKYKKIKEILSKYLYTFPDPWCWHSIHLRGMERNAFGLRLKIPSTFLPLSLSLSSKWPKLYDSSFDTNKWILILVVSIDRYLRWVFLWLYKGQRLCAYRNTSHKFRTINLLSTLHLGIFWWHSISWAIEENANPVSKQSSAKNETIHDLYE